ncbi:MAG: L-erythro-3,5-diaminohexanoate dehydrogenase [Vulcanimicrobiaceae bacterium]
MRYALPQARRRPRFVTPQPCPLGTHRVIAPPGSLPQAAWKLDVTPIAYANEILCDVDALNIDSASFRQIAGVCDGDEARLRTHVLALVAERGKHHNPVTGSGGMFVGRVRTVGADLAATHDLQPGDRIASLVSLTLTPLRIERIERVDMATGRLWIVGTAVLFASGKYAVLPDDLPVDVALAVLDVAGAPAHVRRLASPGATVAVVGADGKSGLLACVAARAGVGPHGRVVGIGPDAGTAAARLLVAQYVDAFVEADARDARATLAASAATLPTGADLTVNCVNVAGTEMASILLTRGEGTVCFFSMCTSFTAAALGAEGVGKDVTMIVGNGYVAGHAALALDLLREHAAVRAYFVARYGAVPPPGAVPV